jgi:hypothetical protein
MVDSIPNPEWRNKLFRIEFFCDDKKLAEALRGLAGIALGDPKIMPVVNGEASNGKVVARTPGELPDLFKAYAKSEGLKIFQATDIKKFCKHLGRPESSYGYYLKRLMASGVFKKSGKGAKMIYTLVPR